MLAWTHRCRNTMEKCFVQCHLHCGLDCVFLSSLRRTCLLRKCLWQTGWYMCMACAFQTSTCDGLWVYLHCCIFSLWEQRTTINISLSPYLRAIPLGTNWHAYGPYIPRSCISSLEIQLFQVPLPVTMVFSTASFIPVEFISFSILLPHRNNWIDTAHL